MKQISIAVAALLGGASALKIQQGQDANPDVFGPNGVNYTNNSPDADLSRIKIDIHQQGDGKGDADEFC